MKLQAALVCCWNHHHMHDHSFFLFTHGHSGCLHRGCKLVIPICSLWQALGSIVLK
jgi:hypothetical protein